MKPSPEHFWSLVDKVELAKKNGQTPLIQAVQRICPDEKALEFILAKGHAADPARSAWLSLLFWLRCQFSFPGPAFAGGFAIILITLGLVLLGRQPHMYNDISHDEVVCPSGLYEFVLVLYSSSESNTTVRITPLNCDGMFASHVGTNDCNDVPEHLSEQSALCWEISTNAWPMTGHLYPGGLDVGSMTVAPVPEPVTAACVCLGVIFGLSRFARFLFGQSRNR